MATSNEIVEILNDLVKINNDRIAGYEKALKELEDKDSDLKSMFIGIIDESRKVKMALGEEVQVLGGDIATGTMASGKIYRVWMDVKAVFTGHDRHTVLANCEEGEDAAQDAYKTALAHNLPAFLHEMVQKQQIIFKATHDEIKVLRDQAATN